MKKVLGIFAILLTMGMLLTGCQKISERTAESSSSDLPGPTIEGATWIQLSDDGILVNGNAISTNERSPVYAANDIIFYLEGQGISYGEGTDKDEHSQEEADAHTVVHITEPGTYEITGTLSAGQICVDLGDGAKKKEEAVVTLALNNMTISCNVAPGILFKNVYECGDKDKAEATMDVDLTNAGANILLVEDSVNHVTGSYVAKIYESCELNEAGTEVLDSEKLWKFDAAVYSRRSMNISGEGFLGISAANEGLGTELHLAVNGGEIHIDSGNDGINVNEEKVSVFTMNGGSLNIKVNGSTGEGDGIDSNGWLVINDGKVDASACGTSMDSGIDSDMGIHITGGTIVASGNMMDHIEKGEQATILFSVHEGLKGGEIYQLKDEEGNLIDDIVRANDCQMLVVSRDDLEEGKIYTLWKDGEQIAESSKDGMMHGPSGRPGMIPPEGERGPRPEGKEPPEGFEPGKGPLKKPEGMKIQ